MLNNNQFKKNLKLSTLSGLQRALILAMYDDCQTNDADVTAPLSLDHLLYLTGGCYTKDGLKTALYHLKYRGYIKIIKHKSGRGGWACYALAPELSDDISQYQQKKKMDKPASKNKIVKLKKKHQSDLKQDDHNNCQNLLALC